MAPPTGSRPPVPGPSSRLAGLAALLRSHNEFADVVGSLEEGHGATIGGTWGSSSALAAASLASELGDEIFPGREIDEPIVARSQRRSGAPHALLRVPIRNGTDHHPPKVGTETERGIVMKPLRPLPVTDEDVLGHISRIGRLETMGAAPAQNRPRVEIDKLRPRLWIVGRLAEPIEEGEIGLWDV